MEKDKTFKMRLTENDRVAITALAERLEVKSNSQAVRQAVYTLLRQTAQTTTPEGRPSH